MLLLDMISHTTAKALVEWLLEQPLNGIAITTMCDSTVKISLTVSNQCRWACGVCTWSCFYQCCCQVRAIRESIAMVTIVAHPLLFSHSAMCAAEPTPPNITRNRPGPALNSPVVIRANNASI